MRAPSIGVCPRGLAVGAVRLQAADIQHVKFASVKFAYSGCGGCKPVSTFARGFGLQPVIVMDNQPVVACVLNVAFYTVNTGINGIIKGFKCFPAINWRRRDGQY